MKIFFAGTPSLSISTLESLCSSRHEVVGVLTAADKKTGRGQQLSVSPIKEWARRRDIPVLSPLTLKDPETLEEVASFKADIMVVFAYGKIFRQEFLDLFPLGAVNVHPSLLPLHRGPSPLVATILSLDKEAGITIQKMALKMDTGNILVQESRPLTGKETLQDLMAWTSERSPQLLLEGLEKVEKGYEGVAQKEEDATYCHMITKEMGYLDLESPVESFVAQVRALNPSPATRLLTRGKEEIVLRSACVATPSGVSSPEVGSILGLDPQQGLLVRVGEGVAGFLEIQRQGKKSLGAREFWNGLQNKENFGFRSMQRGEEDSCSNG
jgi:methionyl-tRNA formyltransferase